MTMLSMTGGMGKEKGVEMSKMSWHKSGVVNVKLKSPFCGAISIIVLLLVVHVNVSLALNPFNTNNNEEKHHEGDVLSRNSVLSNSVNTNSHSSAINRVVGGSTSVNTNIHSIVLPHDTYPGYSIKIYEKIHQNKNRNASVDRHSINNLSFRLLETGFSKYFTMLNDGFVMTTMDLSPLINQSVYLKVLEENVNSSQVHQLQLYVMDRKDILRFSELMVDTIGEVLENQPRGTKVYGVPQIVADSDNLKKKTAITYSLINDPENAFGLSRNNTKEIYKSITIDKDDDKTLVFLVTNKPLDRETKAEYQLTIEATAHLESGTVNKAMATIVVHILDDNDNRPVFQSPVYEFIMVGKKSRDLQLKNETEVFWPRFKRIGVVEAKDADNDKVAYKLLTPNNYIIIVPQTGELLLVGDPPPHLYESPTNENLLSTNEIIHNKLELEIEAHDVRIPSLSSSKSAKILIEFVVPETSILDDQEALIGRDKDTTHHRDKRRVTRAVRPTKRIEFTEADGGVEGKNVFQLEKETDKETFKIRDENPWVTVETNGAVRVKKKWDYEELGPEKTIDFWVIITNAGHNGKVAHTFHYPINVSSVISFVCSSEMTKWSLLKGVAVAVVFPRKMHATISVFGARKMQATKRP